ncbi:MAG TPA: hypothetical protein VHX86_17130 [Tepidisphaeraceae bacterium]|nr:hypothetical protein [Tepidisphaeraceae bacterium]
MATDETSSTQWNALKTAVLAAITTASGDGVTNMNAHWLLATMRAHQVTPCGDSEEQNVRAIFELSRAGSLTILSGKPDDHPSRISFALPA